MFKFNNKDTRTTPLATIICGLFPAKKYVLKFNNKNTRKICEIYSKLTKMHQNDVNDVVLVSLLLTLNMFYNLLQVFLLLTLRL